MLITLTVAVVVIPSLGALISTIWGLAQGRIKAYFRYRVEQASQTEKDRVDGLRPVRQLVRFSTADQVCSPPRMARHLWSQVQSQVGRKTRRCPRQGTQAPVVHTRACDHYGRGPTDLLCATARRPFSQGPIRRPCLLLEEAPQGEIPGVHRLYGSHLLGQTDLARIHLALVLRDLQLLPEDPDWSGGLPRPILRGGGQIRRRGSSGLGLRRVSFRSRTFCPNQNIRRHRPAASGRAHHRLAEGSHRDSRRNRRHRFGSPAFLASRSAVSLAPDCLPACESPGFKTILSPGCFRTPLRSRWMA